MKFLRLKFLLWYTLFMVALSVFFVWGADYEISKAAQGKTFSDVNAVPFNKTGLLLGTSKYAASGGHNLYYGYRIDAAVALFKAGKIKYIVVSGDNSIACFTAQPCHLSVADTYLWP